MVRNIGLGSWIARRANMAPDRVALVFRGRRWTYRQLDERIRRLARALAARGVGEGDRVAFLGQNHPAALETLFACGLLGAIAVPVHPGFDDDAVARILEDAAPAALIFTPELAAKAQRAGARVALGLRVTTAREGEGVERYEELLDAVSDEPIDRAIGLDHPCILAYSSGTTGPNKGVVLSHGNLLFNAVNVLTCLDYLRDDVLLASAPLYRMGGLGFLLALFLKGGTCILHEGGDPEGALARIARHRVTILFDSVHALEAMRRAPSFASADLSSLRVCLTGGSVVPVELVEAFRRRGVPLQPGYGLTEASPLALIVDRDEVSSHMGAAGRPPLFGAARVVDRDLEDVGRGRIGELLVNGPNVMQGYWRAPEATSRALVADRWLRTGDAARVDDDGMITVVGRVADAMILGDAVAHPGPLEARVREAGGRECAIVQRAPNESPVAFVVADDSAFDRRKLRGLARALLGRVHLRIRVVPALPKNANGKVLRQELSRSGDSRCRDRRAAGRA